MKCIFIHEAGKKNRNEVLGNISKNIAKNDTQSKEIYNKFIAREDLISTGLGDQIAIPHCSVHELNDDYVVYYKCENEIDWNSLDNVGVKYIFAIITSGEGESHLEIISEISKLLINEEEKRKILSINSLEQFEELFKKDTLDDENDNITTSGDTGYDIVAITCCPSGLAHTFISRDVIVDYARKNKLTVKVETRGRDGIKNKLTPNEIRQAKIVIKAIDKPILLEDYYSENANILNTTTVDVVRNLEKIIKKKNTNLFFLKTNLYKAFVGNIININIFIKIGLLYLGLYVFFDHYLNIQINNQNEINEFTSVFSNLAICLYGSYAIASLFGETKFIVTMATYMPLLIPRAMPNIGIAGFFIITLANVLFCLFQKWLFDKKLNRFNLKNIKLIINGVVAVGLIMLLLITYGYLIYINIYFSYAINFIKNNLYINAALVYILLSLYSIDFGGKVNKFTMSSCYLLIVFSLNTGLENAYLYPGTVLLFGSTFPNFIFLFSSVVRKDWEYSKTLCKDIMLPRSENCKMFIKKYGFKHLVSLFVSYLLLAFAISYFQVQYFVFITNPLGGIFGFLYQPKFIWGVTYISIWISALILGIITNEMLLLKRRSKSGKTS